MKKGVIAIDATHMSPEQLMKEIVSRLEQERQKLEAMSPVERDAYFAEQEAEVREMERKAQQPATVMGDDELRHHLRRSQVKI